MDGFWGMCKAIGQAVMQIDKLKETSPMRTTKTLPPDVFLSGQPMTYERFEEIMQGCAGRGMRNGERGERGDKSMQIDRLKHILADLDALQALDIDYAKVFSTMQKQGLRRGETWRGRLVRWIEQMEGQAAAEGQGS